MINLSKRLSVIASLIDKDDDTLDIGCDHALLDIYLSNKYDKVCYASDLRESALSMAKANLKKYNSNKVVLLCGNGLDVLDKCENVDTLIISGMGYMSIINILKNIKNKKNIKKLVIESNTNPEKVRKFVLKNNFYIDKEEIVFDKNIYYIVTSFIRGHKKYTRIEKEIGVFNGKDLTKYIELEIKKNNILLKIVPKKYFLKRIEIKRKIKYLEKKKI